MVSTTVVLDREAWNLLAELARIRATERGGRPSQSAVIRDLIRKEAERKPAEGGLLSHGGNE